VVSNPQSTQGNQHLSFAYFQKCINPIFLAQLQSQGSATTNTCAGGGCHDTVTGTGGAFRLIGAAPTLDVSDPANSPTVIRASDIYKNFYSAQGMVVVGNTTESRLVVKPLVLGVFHGGGQVLPNENDPNIKLIKYWITHPAPLGGTSSAPPPTRCSRLPIPRPARATRSERRHVSMKPRNERGEAVGFPASRVRP
jgi:hypothetical protein